MGPPMRPPLTRPNVAAAMASVTPPVRPYWSSRSFPNAAPVPWPPVIVIDPATSPRKGLTPSTVATATPSASWNTTSTVASPQKSSTCGPPTLSSARLAPRPIDVKNAIMRGA